MIDLEHALNDLAEHLDVPDREHWRVDLTRRLTGRTPLRRRNRATALVAAAAAIVVLGAGVVAVAPARRSVAGWLGIGAVEVRQSAPPPTGPTSSSSTRPPVRPIDLATARRQVQFEITTPSDAGPPSRVSVDRRVPGGLVTLAYDRFTLVEIATHPSEPVIAKFVGGGPIQDVAVRGDAGMWITDAHSIGYIDRTGRLRPGTLRRSGPVLVWTREDVTYRVEGPHTLDDAMAIAITIA